MACRDYDFDYEIWLQRSRQHLDAMIEMLRHAMQSATKQSIAIPPAVRAWSADATHDALTKEVFDGTARMLCSTCRALEEKGTLPTSVVAWWTEHKARDEQAADMAKGLSPTPNYADFWAEHAAKEALLRGLPGINHLDAVRALEKVGFRVLRHGKQIVVSDGTRQILVPRVDPVNEFAMAGIVARAGLTEEAFRKLL